MGGWCAERVVAIINRKFSFDGNIRNRICLGGSFLMVQIYIIIFITFVLKWNKYTSIDKKPLNSSRHHFVIIFKS